MKRLFSKRSGFTLVEIIIAFAIFAIMASMIVQVLNLMVRQKVRNKKFEDGLSVQEEQFIARTKDMSYNSAKDPDGQLQFQFKDNGGADIDVEDIKYQLKNWDPDNARNGINYFAGDYEYELDTTGIDRFGDEDGDGGDKNPSTIGGSSQMSWFDTRITGTKGIKSIQIDVTKPAAYTYQITVTVDDSDVDEIIKENSQITLYFAEGKPNAKPITVERVSIDDDSTSLSTLKKVKLCGTNGVNIHCNSSDGFDNSSTTFTVELAEDIDVDDLKFGAGENVSGGNTYGPYISTSEDKDGNEIKKTYVNIFGAYPKDGSSTSTPSEGDDEPDDTEE